MNKNRFVVYTVITGYKEEIRNPFPYNSPDYERICFTDNPELESKDWTIVPIDNHYLKSERESRRPKLLPHRFLPDFEYSLYIDNTVDFKVDPLDIYKKYINSDSSLVCFNHPWRDCIYDEGEIIIKSGFDDEYRVREQLDFYHSQGFPRHNGLIAGTVLFRKHLDAKLIDLTEEWFNHVLRYSKRDQLSFPFIAWHKNFYYSSLDGSLLSNPIIDWLAPKGVINRIPSDFKDEIYLWLNPEIAVSNISPKKHYLEIGAPRKLPYRRYVWELEILANKYKTDKGNSYYNCHGYAPVYQKYLSKYKDLNINLLELGLLRHDVQKRNPGGPYNDAPSLKMWREYFPNAFITGFDIADFSECTPLKNVNIVRGDMGKISDLDELVQKSKGKFDVIIDDASHASHHQQIALGHLFKHLQEGGFYIIEDLHYQPVNLEYSGIKKTIDVLKSLEKGILNETDFLNIEKLQYILDNIDYIHFYDSQDRQFGQIYRDALAIIKKKDFSSQQEQEKQIAIHNTIKRLDMQKLQIDLGCGIHKTDNFIGVDICPGPGVDIVADLSKKFPFDDNSVDEIKAHDIIEHLQDRIHTMNEIWRVCKPGAKVDIRVPSTDGRGAFQDPTHISFWNINSFLYYCSEFPAYLELCRKYGFKGEFKSVKLEHEESPGGVIHVKAELLVVKPISDLNKHEITGNSHFTITQEYQQEIQKEFAPEVDMDIQEQDIVSSLSIYVQQYQQDPTSRTAIANLRQLRHNIAEQLLNTADDEIQNVYIKKISKVHQIFLSSGIKNHALTITEQTLVDELVQNISQGLEQPKAIQYLLTAMLYCRPDQLPLDYDFSHIPHWLIKDYLQFLFSSPVNFKELGEAENYYNYMQGWLNYLHKSIFTNPDSPLWQEVVKNFVQIANFIPLYFNEINLKYIYIKRAEIIEYFLKINGFEIDYELPERLVNRKKIRLGILAGHFTPSAETFAYLPVYEYLSREFEVILYSLNQTGHPLEQYCQSCANSFKQLPKDLVAQVNNIRADDLDILFIATNVTAVTNQICLLATHRLARIQVTSGGSVVTTGMRHMDYYISGTFTDPSLTAQEYYREKLIKLEGTAHCFSYGCNEEKATIKVDRESLDIPEKAVVFISGANFFKITPELIHTWTKIIAEVPNSVLVLLPFGPNWSNTYPKKAFENKLAQVFSQYKISIDRLIILAPQPIPNREDVKEYFKIADVYLDSYPFAGTTSLVEPFQVNLPVIARRGNNFRSAMGAAMVQSLGISDLIADSEESYIKLAVNIGKNPELRQQKSAEIKEKMQDNPSFLDSRSYSVKIGNLFHELFNNYQINTLNENFRLRDINLIIFPDWNQPEESIGLELQEVIKTLATHPDYQKTTLLIDTNNIAVEDAEMFLSSVAMNLLMEEDLDVTEELGISLVGELSNIQCQALLPRIQARIILENENQAAMTKLSMEKLPQRQLESFLLSAV